MTWRDVLDCKNGVWALEDFLKIVDVSGYKFFAWNGDVYFFKKIDGRLDYLETGIRVESL